MRKRITKDQISAPLTRTQVSELASPQSSIESPRPSIGQTGAYVQDSFDDSVSQRDNGHEQATASEEVFTLHAFKGLQQAIGAHRRQVQALAGATDALVQQLESVRDCCSNPSQSRHRALVEQSAAAWPVQMDLLLQTSQISANTLAHLSSRIKADIEEPLEKIQQDIVINAELSRERNTAKMVLLRDGIRKEEVYSLKMGRKKGAGDGSHDLKKDEIDRLTKATPVLLDTLTLKQQPQILAVTARGAKLQLTALERVAEGVCKQQRDSDDSIRRVKEFADMIDKMLYSDMALER